MYQSTQEKGKVEKVQEEPRDLTCKECASSWRLAMIWLVLTNDMIYAYLIWLTYLKVCSLLDTKDGRGIYIVSTIMVIYAYYKSYSKYKAEPNQSKYFKGQVHP